MAAVIAWLQANSTMVFGVLWGVSEVLALIPGVKANSVFQLVVGALAMLKPKSEELPK